MRAGMSSGLISALPVISGQTVRAPGKYILGGEELTLNSKGESMISYADYAIAMVDEAVNGGNIQKRISVVSE